jgi:hypothetical protein
LHRRKPTFFLSYPFKAEFLCHASFFEDSRALSHPARLESKFNVITPLVFGIELFQQRHRPRVDDMTTQGELLLAGMDAVALSSKIAFSSRKVLAF